MGNFSRDPQQVLTENLAKGYVGLHLQQGVPLLDRDVNLMQDLIVALIRQLFTTFIGDGMLGDTAFRILASDVNNNFDIQPGTALVNGIPIVLPALLRYSTQTGVPALTTPTNAQPNPRIDTVYLDVSVREQTAADDDMLANEDDIGIETSVRLQSLFVVRVAENTTTMPAPVAGHNHILLARLNRPRNVAPIQLAHVQDMRQLLSPLPNLDQRLRVFERMFAPRIVSINPPFQSVNTNITISGANLNTSGAAITFIPTNTAIAPASAMLVSATDTQIITTVPNFPGAAGGIPCRIRIQTVIGTAESDPATQPFTVNDAVP